MSDLSGTRLGKYFVDEKVAIGGMAEIYRAHTVEGAPVAIKVVLPNFASEQKFVQMFLDEARIVTALKHPNIVRLFDFGMISGNYYYSMEWIDGKPLSEVVRRQRELKLPFPVDVALLIVLDMCRGLDYAHERRDRFDRPLGIVHRDVSPPNILLTRSGVSKLTDFGIADARNKIIQTRPGVIRGKFSYMSPEQARGEVVDKRSDVFSLGIVLYELLTSTRLFLRDYELDTLEAVRRCEIPAVRPQRRGISPALEGVVRKSLAADIGERYRSAEEFGDELRDVLEKEYPDSSLTNIVEFLQVLFPWETFVGVEAPVISLLGEWRKRQESMEDTNARMAVRHPILESLLTHRYAAAWAMGFLTLALVEIIVRFRPGLLALLDQFR